MNSQECKMQTFALGDISEADCNVCVCVSSPIQYKVDKSHFFIGNSDSCK